MNGSDEWEDDVDDWKVHVEVADQLRREIGDLTMNLYQYLYDVNEGDGPTWIPPSGLPYCGCTTCDTREAMIVLVPLIAQAVTEKRIRRTVEPPLGSVIPLHYKEDK
jgi:hypothetical protein